MFRSRSISLALISLLAASGFATDALANPSIEVASAFDEGDAIDVHSSVSYEYSSRSSAIKREFSGLPGTDPNGPMPIVKDLLFSGTTHTLVPRIELGLFKDFWASVELPVILHDSRSLSFDQRSTPCVFPGEGTTPTCINNENSTTIQDGLLPDTGFDANDPNGPGFTSGSTIFRGPNRSGLNQLHLGIGVAPMNQERDPSKPTWKVGAQLKLPVGTTKNFNRFDPDQSTGVSEGLTEIRLWTSMAKKLGWAVPHFEFWWEAPIAIRDDAPLAPLDQPFGSTSVAPQQEGGTRFGVEATLWEKPEDDLRVGVDASATIRALFEGRGYSDMWEIFQYAGVATESDAPLVLDSEPTVSGTQALSHPGVTNMENFMTFNTQLNVTADIGERVRFGAGFGMYFEQDHIITFADAGSDLPTCTGGAVANCEVDDNNVVDAGTVEVNPLHNSLIDQVGHRYRVEEAKNFLISVNARFLF